MPHRFSGIPEAAGRSRSRFLERLRRSDFPVSRKIPELLPLNAADLLCSRPLTKTENKDTITSTAQADPLIPKRNLSKQAEPPLRDCPAVKRRCFISIIDALLGSPKMLPPRLLEPFVRRTILADQKTSLL